MTYDNNDGPIYSMLTQKSNAYPNCLTLQCQANNTDCAAYGGSCNSLNEPDNSERLGGGAPYSNRWMFFSDPGGSGYTDLAGCVAFYGAGYCCACD